MRSAEVVVVGGSGDGDDVVAIEEPVDILEGVAFPVGVVQKNGFDAPIPQISGGYESQDIAVGIGVLLLADEREVSPGHRVAPDGELVCSAEEIDEIFIGVEGYGPTVFGDVDDGGGFDNWGIDRDNVSLNVKYSF